MRPDALRVVTTAVRTSLRAASTVRWSAPTGPSRRARSRASRRLAPRLRLRIQRSSAPSKISCPSAQCCQAAKTRLPTGRARLLQPRIGRRLGRRSARWRLPGPIGVRALWRDVNLGLVGRWFLVRRSWRDGHRRRELASFVPDTGPSRGTHAHPPRASLLRPRRPRRRIHPQKQAERRASHLWASASYAALRSTSSGPRGFRCPPKVLRCHADRTDYGCRLGLCPRVQLPTATNGEGTT